MASVIKKAKVSAHTASRHVVQLIVDTHCNKNAFRFAFNESSLPRTTSHSSLILRLIDNAMRVETSFAANHLLDLYKMFISPLLSWKQNEHCVHHFNFQIKLSCIVEKGFSCRDLAAVFLFSFFLFL